MAGNEQIIQQFYSAFAQRDYVGMRACYSESPVFSDPVFGLLEGNEPGAMWEMLCKGARDFSLQFGNIRLLDDEYATCDWTANYLFSATGRPVENKVKAHLRIQDGKITEHTDQFDFYRWSRQALGLSGWLLGWTRFMQGKVHRNAVARLEQFMKTNGYA
ncbi:MAG: nuclear transport factor 2 family protein [Bacteroidota bacterium]|nr:nuclear transport factor 2 family protein [Bacteroidota bacterium]